MKTTSMLTTLLALALGTLGSCTRPADDKTECDFCPKGLSPYRCAVPSSSNVICAGDDAQAFGLCPEGATLIECDGGSGGQSNQKPKTPDAKLESKAK